ncbi:DEAD/DEAH box helicase [Synechocystis sp. PCC 7509]|uniref:DEAD/DEAH box helicase n=1 Tax=Synechocystis sp. PCC 7509 TaxID=927677 RepID=UPI0002AC8207|nr:SNF2-related protein [Synechocystis sp. PCC 7509]
MKVLHGTWIPSLESDFMQTGAFYLWVEIPDDKKRRSSKNIHPGSLNKAELAKFLTQELGIAIANNSNISPQYFALPTVNNQPLASPELIKYLEGEVPTEYEEFQDWQIDCYQTNTRVKTGAYNSAKVNNVIKLLNDIHFLALYSLVEVQLGTDFLFWYHYTQFFKQIILKEQYIPAFKYRELAAKKGKNKSNSFEIYAAWEIISDKFETELKNYLEYLPLICVAGSPQPRETIELIDPETLLRHFSECLLHDIITHTPSTAKFDKQIANTIVYSCLHPEENNPQNTNQALAQYKQWSQWKERLIPTQTESTFDLCFLLQEAQNKADDWQLHFVVNSKQDPSYKLALADYWSLNQKSKKDTYKYFGQNFETNLLLNLGYAARMYPTLWQGLETDQPIGLQLQIESAFEFLSQSAWVLEDAGYKVIVPAWWTPEGRRKAKLRLKTSGRKSSATKTNKQGYFSLDSLVQYQYSLSIGGEEVTQKEWQQLVEAKTPLVQFRGQWMELDPEKMQQLLEFWRSHGEELPEMKLLDLMKIVAESEDLEVDREDVLAEMMLKLHDKSQLEPISDPPKLLGKLREYQKRGVSWLQYLEQLGLNGCLADDMGLGKSVQVITQLVMEKEAIEDVLPTLLIAPTSVVGNWQKEVEKFAPHLRVMVHHGSNRIKLEAEFIEAIAQHDIVITSFNLARQDEKLLQSVEWQRVVIDEAQNIKNPKTAQTKAVLKLSSHHRLALTGTPVENRLLDLWSIFNFLNPGYLGKEAQFRKSFEIPIQKDNDRVKSNTLKKLVEPLILRRVKTDKSIINDLPDKVEQKLYCNLTKEQASLYEAIVKDVTEQVESAEGIQRSGLILSTLMKLKQICNHPAQFLQDGSEFSTTRSHKLSRLSEMVEEAISEGESILIFSQFKEIGDSLEKYLKHLKYNTYFIHGGTSRTKREQFITEFQNPETEPSVFILSLKAGGVGITLTKANHVFHFDRWWNPAVENQATDRAFRIGQNKNVFVHKFIAIGTLEERIDQMIEDKKTLSSMIVGNDEAWLTKLDNEAFKQLISLSKTAVLE